MRIWFVCKAKYQKEDDEGHLKNTTETYLLDAVSYTEAEAIMYEKLSERVRGEFVITSLTKSRITDVFLYEDADFWHKCKITYFVTDADSGKEKKVTNLMIVTAHDVKDAYDRIHQSLNNMLVTFRVPEVVETSIVEVFAYGQDREEEEEVPAGFKPVSEVEESDN
jgi:hypothetical protein